MMNSKVLHKQRGRKTLLALAMGSGLLLAACGGGQDSMGADGSMSSAAAVTQGASLRVTRADFTELSARLRNSRLCDLSGCYVAWQVVDSDGDGVCDADEIMAGTNPFDPLSKPSLQVVAELSGKSQLPSFEAGRGAFAVFPAKMQEQLQEYYKGKSPIEQAFAFPLGIARGDSLSRAGIKVDQLKEYGLDPDRDGFTVGFERATESGLPARRVGGMDVSLISDEKDDELTPLPKNLPPPYDHVAEPDPNGDVRHYFADGSGISLDKNGKVLRVWYTNPDADAGATEPTAEQKQAFERLRGAVTRTVEGWFAPGVSGELPQDKKPLIMLVDPEYAGLTAAMVLDPPRLTTAQPEVSPDLPRPDVPAGSPGGKDGCTVGCDK